MTDALTQTEEAQKPGLTSAQARQQCERVLLEWVEQQERRDAERARHTETARRNTLAA